MENYDEATKAAGRVIVFLKSTKPVSWEDEVSYYEQRMKQWIK
jgi:hypothetical protein